MDRHNNFKKTLISAALASILAAPAFADTEQETITILGKTYRNTATKTVLAPEETPQSLNVIESEQLELRGVKSVMQALRYAPGVSTENKGGAVVITDWVNIRGFSSTDNYYDGIMLPGLPGWNVKPQIDPIAIERVEIFKGPTSVLYGTMPPGGMVNIIGKAPQREDSTKISFATSSHNLMEASIDTTGSLSDNVAYRLIALGRKKDTQIDYVEEERYLIAPSIDWYATDNTFVNFNLYYQNDPSLGQNVTVPLTAIQSGAISPSTFAGDVNYNTIERDFLITGYKINHDFNSHWSFLQNFSYMQADLYQESMATGTDYDPATGNVSRTAFNTDEDSKGFSVDNQLSGFGHLGSSEHYLLVGMDYRDLEGSATSDYFLDLGGNANLDLHNPNNDFVNIGDLNKYSTTSSDVEMSQLGFYLQDQILIDNWVLIAGGRYDRVEIKNVAKSDVYIIAPGSSASSTTTDVSNFSYRVGALYKFDNGLSPFANFATSFEPIPASDAAGEALEPEVGEQVEVGIKFDSYERDTTASAALFHITKSNVAYRRTGTDPYSQIGEIRSQGFELEGRTMMGENLDVIANYTYTDMEITKDADATKVGQTPVFVPDHTANLWTNYTFNQGNAQGLRIGGGVRYIGKAVLNDSSDINKGELPSATLFDMSVGYDLGQFDRSLKGASANVVANNLFNEEYYTCWNEDYCWFGEEQTVEVNVKYEF